MSANNYVQIPFLAEVLEELASLSGKPKVRVPLNEAILSVAIKSGGQGSTTVYGNKEGTSTVASPKSNEYGEFLYWLQEGSYVLTVSKSGYTNKVFEWEAVSQKQSEIPPGTIFYWGGTSAPFGFLLNNGEKYLKTTYKVLWETIGEKYGVATSTEFYVPDSRGRTLIAPDSSAGRVTENNTLGAAGGEQNHTLIAGELPNPLTVSAPYTTAAGGVTSGSGIPPHNGVPSGGSWTGNVVGVEGKAHNNLQPYLVLNSIIKY